MSDARYFIGLDVGGTAMKAGVVDDQGHPLSAVSLPTEAARGPEAGLERMAETIREALRAAGCSLDEIAAIGVATPGLMDIPAGIITESVNMPGWHQVPVRDTIAQRFGKPTAFQNDANAAAMGEYWAGAGKGVRSLVFFTLGTGVGGGIILDGQVLEGRHSHGGELGHLKIEMSHPRRCGCGRLGCLEAYASALAVVKRTYEALNRPGERSSLREVLTSRGELTARDVFTAADQGDELAGRLVEETAYYLAIGAMNAMHTIDPDMIVFGGGMTAAGEGFLERIRYHVRQLAFPIPAERTVVRYAQLGTDAGFIGAAGCGRQLLTGRLALDSSSANA
ncbi:MAG: ROK family protein [Gemmataceae bacterium]